jgi:AraC-like DNA-binding protein
MKTLIQKVHVEEDCSFACRTYRTPQFETNWHMHAEYELIVLTEGHGTAMIGDYVGEYRAGDVFFLAGNLPHWFRKAHTKMTGAAVVAHFLQEILGTTLLAQPEMKKIRHLLERKNGLQLKGSLQQQMAAALVQLEHTSGFERLSMLLHCLHSISGSSSYEVVTQDFGRETDRVNPAIEIIIDYSFRHYLEPITLAGVAAVAGMSIPTFCRFFKQNIKKTYFDFLQDLRISHACKLLANTDKPVLAVCYESGYNSWAHFSKQFRRVKGLPPGRYRKQFVQK